MATSHARNMRLRSPCIWALEFAMRFTRAQRRWSWSQLSGGKRTGLWQNADGFGYFFSLPTVGVRMRVRIRVDFSRRTQAMSENGGSGDLLNDRQKRPVLWRLRLLLSASRCLESLHELLRVFGNRARFLSDAACVCAEVFALTLQGHHRRRLFSAPVAVLSHATAHAIVVPQLRSRSPNAPKIATATSPRRGGWNDREPPSTSASVGEVLRARFLAPVASRVRRPRALVRGCGVRVREGVRYQAARPQPPRVASQCALPCDTSHDRSKRGAHMRRSSTAVMGLGHAQAGE